MKRLNLLLLCTLLTGCFGIRSASLGPEGISIKKSRDIGSHSLINEYLDGDQADYISNMGAVFIKVSGDVASTDSADGKKQDSDRGSLYGTWDKKANKECKYGVKKILERRGMTRQINTNFVVEGLVICNDAENATPRGDFF